MNINSLRAAVGICAAAAAASAWAEAKSIRCPAALPAMTSIGGHSEARASYEQIPAACLKPIVLRCSADASKRMLDMAEAGSCSFAYEALLKTAFRGDFNAFLAWWRANRS
jgi:hypothetical protein